jgi:cytochrome c556
MRPSNTCARSVALLISASIALSGCGRGATRPINISYRQVGICKGYDTAAGRVTARSEEAFAIFKIEAVDNTQSSERFDFDPTHLYVDQSTPEQKAKTAVWDKNRRFVYSDQRFAQNVGVSSAVESTIPEGIKREINGFAVVPLDINNPSGGPEANQYSFDLVYDIWSTDEHEANGPGGSFFWIFALGESLFGGSKLESENIDLLNNYRLAPAGSCERIY